MDAARAVHDLAEVTVYDCRPGRLDVSVTSARGATVALSANYIPLATVRIPAGGWWAGSIPTPPDAAAVGVCIFTLDTDVAVKVTRLAFERGARLTRRSLVTARSGV